MSLVRNSEMWKDWQACDDARLDRDPAYDGLFFTCVRTTKIYCRPICPVAHAFSKNVFYVPSAAAAEKLGFRPCLRCRPEAAPGSPAWQGTKTTVSRGMRLIESGYLDSHSVQEFAETLGVTTRHLNRLFQKHAAASPIEIATTRRVQAAKRMIDQTNQSLSFIAHAAGFGSIRNFNTAFKKTYRRTPSSFRNQSRKSN